MHFNSLDVYLMVDVSLDVAMTTELLSILFALLKMVNMRKKLIENARSYLALMQMLLRHILVPVQSDQYQYILGQVRKSESNLNCGSH